MAIELKMFEYKRLNAFFADYAKNIGRGGMFIRTDRPLPVGTDFLFRFKIPSIDEPLRLLGRVQWLVNKNESTEAQPAGMGIGFLYDSEADRERIHHLAGGLMQEHLGPHLSAKLMGFTRGAA